MKEILLLLTCLVICGCESNSTQSSNSQPQTSTESTESTGPRERNLGDTLAHAAVAGAAAGAAGTVAAKATDHVIDKAKRRAKYKRIKAHRASRSRG